MRYYSAGVLASLLLQQAAAHGTVNSVSVGGTTYQGYEPSNKPGSQPNPAKGVVWASNDYELGFVLPTDYANANIICHKNALPAPKAATVAAGGTISLSWPNWPATDPHPGVFLNYLAPAGTEDPAKIDKNSLKFFKISQAGADPSVAANGDDKGLATGAFKKAGRVAQVQIPATIKPGTYVLRHEIIALHEAETINKAQNYPQCITIQVTGGGSATPAGVPATTFYKATDPGILVKNFYNKWDPKAYVMPGPAVWDGASSGTSAAAAAAAPVVAAPATSAGASAVPALATRPSAVAAAVPALPARPSAGSSASPKSSGTSSSSSSSSGSGAAAGGYSQKGAEPGTSSASPAVVSISPVPAVAAAPAAPSVAASPASGADAAPAASGDEEEECKKKSKNGKGRSKKQKQSSSSYERRHARDLMLV